MCVWKGNTKFTPSEAQRMLDSNNMPETIAKEDMPAFVAMLHGCCDKSSGHNQGDASRKGNSENNYPALQFEGDEGARKADKTPGETADVELAEQEGQRNSNHDSSDSQRKGNNGGSTHKDAAPAHNSGNSHSGPHPNQQPKQNEKPTDVEVDAQEDEDPAKMEAPANVKALVEDDDKDLQLAKAQKKQKTNPETAHVDVEEAEKEQQKTPDESADIKAGEQRKGNNGAGQEKTTPGESADIQAGEGENERKGNSGAEQEKVDANVDEHSQGHKEPNFDAKKAGKFAPAGKTPNGKTSNDKVPTMIINVDEADTAKLPNPNDLMAMVANAEPKGETNKETETVHISGQPSGARRGGSSNKESGEASKVEKGAENCLCDEEERLPVIV
jgi:hypothetical protein